MRKSFLDSIDIETPCAENWEHMTGSEQVRLCSHCSKSVHDLSSMSRARAEKLIETSGGGICVRYIKTDQGQIVHRPPLFHEIKRRTGIAAGVLAASLTLSIAGYPQGNVLGDQAVSRTTQALFPKNVSTPGSFSMTGTVTDPVGAVIWGAKVTLRSIVSGNKQVTRTNLDGVFEFKNVEGGDYEIEISAPGFVVLITKVNLTDDYKFKEYLALHPTVTMGLIMLVDGDVLTGEEPAPISDKVETQKLIPLPASKTLTLMD